MPFSVASGGIGLSQMGGGNTESGIPGPSSARVRAERAVDRVRECVNPRRLPRADDHGCLLRTRSGGPWRPPSPTSLGNRPVGRSGITRDFKPFAPQALDLAHDRDEESADLRGRQSQPVVGHRAGDGVRRFDRVQPVHPVCRLLDLSPLAERAAVLDRVRVAAEEVAVEREDAIDLREVVLRDKRLARTRSPRPSALPT